MNTPYDPHKIDGDILLNVNYDLLRVVPEVILTDEAKKETAILNGRLTDKLIIVFELTDSRCEDYYLAILQILLGIIHTNVKDECTNLAKVLIESKHYLPISYNNVIKEIASKYRNKYEAHLAPHKLGDRKVRHVVLATLHSLNEEGKSGDAETKLLTAKKLHVLRSYFNKELRINGDPIKDIILSLYPNIIEAFKFSGLDEGTPRILLEESLNDDIKKIKQVFENFVVASSLLNRCLLNTFISDDDDGGLKETL